MEEKKNPFASLSDKELEAMLKRLEDSNERQASYAKKQYRMSQITALASILILAIVIYTSATIIPRVNRLFDDVETVMDSVNGGQRAGGGEFGPDGNGHRQPGNLQ